MVKLLTSTPELDEDVLLDVELTHGWSVVLYNDNHNTFEWVIDCLVKYCNHDALQAEQCAWIVHTKGKCSVKSGDYSELEPVCTALCDSGLSAALEQ